jgi:hypothetical protein
MSGESFVAKAIVSPAVLKSECNRPTIRARRYGVNSQPALTTGTNRQPWLLKKREGVELEPMLRDPSIDEALELHPAERDLLVGRRQPRNRRCGVP